MSTVFVNVAMSLDGFMAPEGMTMEHFDDPGYRDWGAKWGALMGWALDQRYLREKLKFGEGGEIGPVNDLVRRTFERTGAHIMGKRMFDGGERGWPEEAPFHTPVYVLTHEKRAPWVRPGGTVFHFVNDGPEAALASAREAAGTRDIRICGGAETIQQYLNLGVVEELEIALAPVLFGAGRRLFDRLAEPLPRLRIEEVLHHDKATLLRYVRARRRTEPSPRSAGASVQKITVETTVAAPLQAVWHAYTSPDDIVQWNAASGDWHSPRAEADLREGGAFRFRMEARDGSHGFDFEGVHTRVDPLHGLGYRFGDRHARVDFEATAVGVRVRVPFDPEGEFPLEMQRAGWQAILDRFARHASPKVPIPPATAPPP